MTLGVSIRIFLVDGRPEGLRLVEKSNWSGIGLVCARSEYGKVNHREEFLRPGVYLLTGPTNGTALPTRIYIGEADELRKRISQHAAKDFWTTLVAFTSKDENLNKAHVRYLESKLIGLALAAKRSELDNSTAPPPSHLSESDRADMDGYLAEMLVILPLIGVQAFEVVSAAPGLSQNLLRLSGKGGVDASGEDRAEGFVVAPGSKARTDTVPSVNVWISNLRDELIASGVLAPAGPNLEFTKAHVFESPSAAAGVLLGRSANGRIEWKDSTGRTLKAIQEAELEP